MMTEAEAFQLPVAEQFYSIQGEGRYMGRPAVFLRTAGCNFLCGGTAAARAYEDTDYATETQAMADNLAEGEGTWVCDTIAEWMEGNQYTIEELYDYWGEEGFLKYVDEGAHIVITGGEPLLQEEPLTAFLNRLDQEAHDPFVEVETNGSIYPGDALRTHIDQFNISPKLSNSGMGRERRYNPEILNRYVQQHMGEHSDDVANADFKFVVGTREDWAEIDDDFIEQFEVPKENVYLMPAGGTEDDLTLTRGDVVELAKQHAVQYTDRLQIVIWNQATGV
jgi:6-pyruvoyltetrahydropterin 2'-reductase